MQYRVGTCAGCGATFKVPASFAGDKAKCKSCATGVVHVGPVQDDSSPAASVPAQPAPAPSAQAPAPRPAPPAAIEEIEDEELVEHRPSGKRNAGPSMKERLLASRGTEPAAPAAPRGAPPVPASAPRRTPAAGASQPAARPAASQAPARATARGAPAKAPARADRARSTTASKVAGGATSGAGKSPARGAGGHGAGARRSGAAGHAEPGARRARGERGGGKHDKSKKKSPLPIVASVVGIALVGFGAWKLVLSDKSSVEAEEVAQTPAAPVPPAETDVPAAGDAPVAEPTVTDETTGAEETTDATEAAGEGADAPAEAAAPPAGPDLATFTRFGPDAGTSEEQWAEIQKDVDLMIDPLAGVQGNRARRRLEALGRPAFPAIVNKMLTLDYATEQGYRDGDLYQQALSQICNGRNAGWKYTTSEEDVRFNQKAVALLHKVWDRAKDDEAYWKYYAKVEGAEATPPAEEGAGGEVKALSDDDLDDLDDLDG